MHDLIKLQMQTGERVASIETKLDSLIESVQSIKILHEQCPAREDYQARATLDSREIRSATVANAKAFLLLLLVSVASGVASVIALFRT